MSWASSAFFVLETDWSTSRVQEFPLGIVIVSNETISSDLNSSKVLYMGGPVDGQLVLFRTPA